MSTQTASALEQEPELTEKQKEIARLKGEVEVLKEKVRSCEER